MKLDKQVVASRKFQIPVFDNRVTKPEEPTWIFIDGDGSAWLRDGLASPDPTPMAPLALDLMLQVPGAHALYLGRPCTFDLARSDSRCNPGVWTVDRYSTDVVESMHEALRSRVGEGPVVLVGFSGGGVLALQMAARMERPVGVLTIAANLDVARWAEHHGYTRSLAARSAPFQFPLQRRVPQLHVFGGQDSNAPLSLAADLLARDPRVRVKVFAAADHGCCWRQLWPQINAEFQQLMEASVLTRDSSEVR